MEVSRKVLRRAAQLADTGQPFALCTVVATRGSVPGKAGAKMVVERDGRTFGTVGGAGLEEKVKALGLLALRGRKGGMHKFDLAYFRPGALDSLCGGSVEVLVEYMGAVPHILICGGGHVGLEVARLCDQLEYVYSVLDDRAEFAGPERFPAAHQTFVARPEDFFPSADLGAYSHILILGYSHRVDTDILFHCCKRAPSETFVGFISSKLKRREMFARVKERGVTDGELARVQAPLGVAIGAESPAEIAVSILGGVIAHHKGLSEVSALETAERRLSPPLEASHVQEATRQAVPEDDGQGQGPLEDLSRKSTKSTKNGGPAGARQPGQEGGQGG